MDHNRLRLSNAPLENPPSRFLFRFPIALAMLSLLAVGGATLIDLPLQRTVAHTHLGRTVHELFDVIETFGNGIGVLLLLAGVGILDPPRRGSLPRIAAASLGAGLLADVVKMTIGRQRPLALALDQVEVWDTFTGWMPFLSAGPSGQGFPSAHTATAAGLAVALMTLYPRGRWLFLSLAVGVGIQRISVSAHFLSDVIAGGTLGVFWASRCMFGRSMSVAFSRLETFLDNFTPFSDRMPSPATDAENPEKVIDERIAA